LGGLKKSRAASVATMPAIVQWFSRASPLSFLLIILL
jgi:hypothetical protein